MPSNALQALSEKLKHLENQLHRLPASLPDASENPCYDLQGFPLSSDSSDVNDYGWEGALNWRLEITLAPKGRNDGPCPFVIKEQLEGPNLIAVISAFRHALDQFPNPSVNDIEKEEHIATSESDWEEEDDNGDIDNGSDEPDTPPLAKNHKNDKKATQKRKGSQSGMRGKKKGKGKIPNAWDEWETAPENKPKPVPSGQKNRGRKRNELLYQLALPCRPKGGGKPRTRCVGMKPRQDGRPGCTKTFARAPGLSGRSKARILNHAVHCQYVPKDLQAKAAEELGGGPSKRVEADQEAATTSETKSLKKANKGRSPKSHNLLDLAILKLFVVRGISLKIASSEEWRNLIKLVSSTYRPPSCTKISDFLIPNEAADILERIIKKLKKASNLTISFDGTTTRLPESIYTIHVITPQRDVYLIKGHEASAESHTAEHIAEAVINVIEDIGPSNFSLVVTDDAGNTKGARRIIQERYPWILNTPDPCHRLNNTVKSIAAISCFKETIKVVRRTIKFFSKSTFAKTVFNRVKARYGISRGLVSAGKTRFATLSRSAGSVKRCLPVIKEVVKKHIEIPEVNDNFITGTQAASSFEVDLIILIAVLEPPAKAITCLESTHSTVADVFIFWLAVMASYDAFLTGQQASGLDTDVKAKIRHILNFRFNQMINDGPSDMYITSFFLHPRYRDSKILKSSRINTPSPGSTPIRGKKATHSRNDLYERIREFLTKQLRIEYEGKKSPLPDLSLQEQWKPKFLEFQEACKRLHIQLQAYAKSEYPFNRSSPPSKSPLEWWNNLLSHNHASVLAFFGVKLFSIMPNSMADERTCSKLKWLNSPSRNRFKASSLICIIQIGNEYLRNQTKTSPRPPPYVPTVKFYNLKKLLGVPKPEAGRKRKRDEDIGQLLSELEDNNNKGSESETDENEDGYDSDYESPDPTAPSFEELNVEDEDRLVYSDLVDSVAKPLLLDFLSDTPPVHSENNTSGERDNTSALETLRSSSEISREELQSQRTPMRKKPRRI